MKNILIKFSAAVLAFLGVSMTGVTPVSHPVKAANKRVKVISKRYVTVWSNYRSGHHKVTHVKKGTSRFVYQTAKDSMGNLWYRIGKISGFSPSTSPRSNKSGLLLRRPAPLLKR